MALVLFLCRHLALGLDPFTGMRPLLEAGPTFHKPLEQLGGLALVGRGGLFFCPTGAGDLAPQLRRLLVQPSFKLPHLLRMHVGSHDVENLALAVQLCQLAGELCLQALDLEGQTVELLPFVLRFPRQHLVTSCRNRLRFNCGPDFLPEPLTYFLEATTAVALLLRQQPCGRCPQAVATLRQRPGDHGQETARLLLLRVHSLLRLCARLALLVLLGPKRLQLRLQCADFPLHLANLHLEVKDVPLAVAAASVAPRAWGATSQQFRSPHELQMSLGLLQAVGLQPL
mmetsp:Transcript_137276/g.382919  ORF Transcript_137276/g.382919 Transcript_137276/m.382919 type:complete len:285 (-) Transcript_137276:368-1222(-)